MSTWRHDEALILISLTSRPPVITNMNPIRILVVDDDPDLREVLCEYLTTQRFETYGAANATEAYQMIAAHSLDLVILDLMLPGEDGFAICKRLRQEKQHLPIMMLTARGEREDRIIGLELGADDYIVKPFDPRELVARIRAIMRRVDKQGDFKMAEAGKLRFGPFTLNIQAHCLEKDGSPIMLTAGEFELLRILSENPNRALSRDELSQFYRGKESDPLDRTIDVMISRLRKVLEPLPGNPTYIRTIRGSGYMFVPNL